MQAARRFARDWIRMSPHLTRWRSHLWPACGNFVADNKNITCSASHWWTLWHRLLRGHLLDKPFSRRGLQAHPYNVFLTWIVRYLRCFLCGTAVHCLSPLLLFPCLGLLYSLELIRVKRVKAGRNSAASFRRSVIPLRSPTSRLSFALFATVCRWSGDSRCLTCKSSKNGTRNIRSRQ